MNELCIFRARYQRKDRHGKRYTEKHRETEPKKQGVSQQASVGAGLMLRTEWR